MQLAQARINTIFSFMVIIDQPKFSLQHSRWARGYSNNFRARCRSHLLFFSFFVFYFYFVSSMDTRPSPEAAGMQSSQGPTISNESLRVAHACMLYSHRWASSMGSGHPIESNDEWKRIREYWMYGRWETSMDRCMRAERSQEALEFRTLPQLQMVKQRLKCSNEIRKIKPSVIQIHSLRFFFFTSQDGRKKIWKIEKRWNVSDKVRETRRRSRLDSRLKVHF